MNAVTPKPFLAGLVSFYRPPGDDLKFQIQLKSPGKNNFAYFSTDFSDCEEYIVAGSGHDVVIVSLETRDRLKWLKGHDENVSVVKFSSDASKVLSGSFDNSVIVWDWKETDTPSTVLKGHRGTITAISFGSDDSKIFSGSRDGTVKVWDFTTCRLCQEFVYGTEV